MISWRCTFRWVVANIFNEWRTVCEHAPNSWQILWCVVLNAGACAGICLCMSPVAMGAAYCMRSKPVWTLRCLPKRVYDMHYNDSIYDFYMFANLSQSIKRTCKIFECTQYCITLEDESRFLQRKSMCISHGPGNHSSSSTRGSVAVSEKSWIEQGPTTSSSTDCDEDARELGWITRSWRALGHKIFSLCRTPDAAGHELQISNRCLEAQEAGWGHNRRWSNECSWYSNQASQKFTILRLRNVRHIVDVTEFALSQCHLAWVDNLRNQQILHVLQCGG